jgi:glycosyltransferase involved in cell wall biosynthesis
MTSIPIISIIIPVYNREHLLSETLDSIIAQTFINWECILVDDISTDKSYSVMQRYKEKDKRFKTFIRPNTIKKGANPCRNFGFLKASGAYIKWFDSDDIMLPEHLSVAYNTLVENNLDFVFTDTVNFSHETGELMGNPYKFNRDNVEITSKNLALEHVGWITGDFLGKREILENVRFNENITTDGDEYNLFVRLLNQTIKGVFINQILIRRRIHKESLTNINSENSNTYQFKLTTIKYQTANDLVVYNNTELIRWFLSGYMQSAYKLALNKKKVPYKIQGFKLICNYYSVLKGLAFVLSLQTARFLKQGYNLMKYARK